MGDLKKQFKVQEEPKTEVDNVSYELDASYDIGQTSSNEDITNSSDDDIDFQGEVLDAQGNAMDYNTELQNLQHKFDQQSIRF